MSSCVGADRTDGRVKLAWQTAMLAAWACHAVAPGPPVVAGAAAAAALLATFELCVSRYALNALPMLLTAAVCSAVADPLALDVAFAVGIAA